MPLVSLYEIKNDGPLGLDALEAEREIRSTGTEGRVLGDAGLAVASERVRGALRARLPRFEL